MVNTQPYRQLGCTIGEMLTGYPPWLDKLQQNYDFMSIINMIIADDKPFIDTVKGDCTNPGIGQLIEAATAKNPDDRPDASQIVFYSKLFQFSKLRTCIHFY